MRAQSLKLRRDFKTILNNGSKRVDGSFIIFSRNNELIAFRFGLVASKKVFPLAVQRNRVKRRFREALRSVFKDNPSLKLDIVLVLRKPGLTIDFKELVTKLERCTMASSNSGKNLRY